MVEYLKGIKSGLHIWVLIIYLFLSCAVPMGIHSSKPFKLLLNFDDLDRSGEEAPSIDDEGEDPNISYSV